MQLAIALVELKDLQRKRFCLLHPGGSLGKRLSLKISEIMYTGDAIPIVKESACLKNAIFEITSKRCGATAVCKIMKELFPELLLMAT